MPILDPHVLAESRSVPVASSLAGDDAGSIATASPTAHGHLRVVSQRSLWVLLYGTFCVTFVASIPAGVRLNSELTPLHLPLESWTLHDLRQSLHALAIPEDAFTLGAYSLSVLAGLMCFTVAAVILVRRPADDGAQVIAILLAIVGWSLAGTHLSLEAALPAVAEVFRAAGMVAFSCLFVLFYVFPTGRFVPRWSRWPALATLVVAPLAVLDSPVNPARWPPFLEALSVMCAVALPLVAQVYRYRRASDDAERRATRWVLVSLGALALGAFSLTVITSLVPELLDPGVAGLQFHLAGNLVLTVLALLVPVTIGVSVLRLRLWRLEPLVNRTLVYASLTVVIGALYVGALGILGALFSSRGSMVLSLVSAGLVAVAFEPLRRLAQGSVNRFMYGDRDEPYVIVTRLADRLQNTLAPGSTLTTIVETVRESFRLPYTAIELLSPSGEPVTTVMTDSAPGSVRKAGEDVVRFPVSHQGEHVASLLAPSRTPQEPLSPHDRRLLAQLAQQAGPVVFAVRATQDLERAHERLVSLGQEERRRLRRDLHDLLGPMLATVAMKLDVASAVGESDGLRSRTLMTEAGEDLRETIALVRKLVYTLYPPVLDQLGLTGAIREHALNSLTSAGVALDLRLPEQAPVLPASAEVAAYHIATEALTNVRRHADARSCHVRLSVGPEHLEVEVVDDGRGIPVGTRPGVGLTAMRERAHELGGTLEVVPAVPAGTRLTATLPIGARPT